MYRDKSIVGDAADQVAIGVNASRQFLQIQNAAASLWYVNYSGPKSGGTGPGGVGNSAAPGSTGTILLQPNGLGNLLFDHFPPQNPIVVQGPNGTRLTINEG